MNDKVTNINRCEIPQLLSGSEPFETNENPDFFLTGTDIYAPVHENNKIKFFTTGEDYFDDVGKAISKAKHTVFITGWQINYDINLHKVDTKKTETYLKARDELQSKLEDELAKLQEEIQRDLPEKGFIDGIQDWRRNRRIRSYEEDIKKYDEKIIASRTEQTLWHCLRAAVQRGVKVYVLPWSCPPVGPVVTYDIECMCAVYQLNVGLLPKGEQRAFFMFSSNKCDLVSQSSTNTPAEFLKNAGNFFFSHHQKSVIIDNEIGFVGGIDLAYGRRDNAMFRLTCGDRVGGDRYNPCIPHIQPAYKSEYVNRIALLLSTMFDMSAPADRYQSFMGWIDVYNRISYWFESPFSWKIAYAFRNFKSHINEKLENVREWALSTFFDPLLGWVINLGLDLTLVQIDILIKQNSQYIQQLREKIGGEYTDKIMETIVIARGRAQAVAEPVLRRDTVQKVELTVEEYLAVIPAIRDWYIKTPEGQLFSSLMDQDITFMMPDENAEKNSSFLELLIAQLLASLQKSASNLPKPYKFLDEKPQPLLPRSGKVLDANIQPRMPWHDVQLRAEGPAVYDLSRNFIDRWNAGQMFVDRASNVAIQEYDLQFKALLIFVRVLFELTEKLVYSLSVIPYIGKYIEKTANEIGDGLDSFGKDFYAARPTPHYINLSSQLPIPPKMMSSKGEDTVQIIRSAPKNFLKYEEQARQKSGIYLDSYLTRQYDPTKSEQPVLGPVQTEPASNTNQQPATEQSNNTLDQLMSYGKDFVTTLATGVEKAQQINQEQTTPKVIGNVNALQTDCQTAWINAINGAQHFIYIESQFFQSDFGSPFGYECAGVAPDFSENATYTGSGPMSSLSQFDPELLPYIKYIGADKVLDSLDVRYLSVTRLKEVVFGFIGRDIDPITGKKEPRPRKLLELKEQLSTVWKTRFAGKFTRMIFADHEIPNKPQKNQVMQAIADRIKEAILLDHNFHTYIVIPVHPEGALNDPTIMHTVHMAMQTLYGGQDSLIRQIQRTMCAHRLMTESEQQGQCITYEDALLQAEEATGDNNDPLYMQEDWQKYLTLLNLRSWEEIGTWRGSRNTTEQIYVHSKLMIVDDRVAILGSCNVNDRSMEGNRDTELAAIVHGNAEKIISINGESQYPVSETVHNFRVKLWRKHFALDIQHPAVDPASSLSSVLNSPAAPATVQAIQQIAKDNLDSYSQAFHYIPQNTSPVQHLVKPQEDKGRYPKPEQNYYPLGCSVWPLWAYKDPDDHRLGGELTNSYDETGKKYDKQMPFEEGFWTNALERKYPKPKTIEGFITALPIYWTMGENNVSSNATTIIALMEQMEQLGYPTIMTASTTITTETNDKA